jgi:hypothetical protein
MMEKELAELITKLSNKNGVLIDSIRIRWIDASTTNKAVFIISEIEISSHKEWPLE